MIISTPKTASRTACLVEAHLEIYRGDIHLQKIHAQRDCLCMTPHHTEWTLPIKVSVLNEYSNWPMFWRGSVTVPKLIQSVVSQRQQLSEWISLWLLRLDLDKHLPLLQHGKLQCPSSQNTRGISKPTHIQVTYYDTLA